MRRRVGERHLRPIWVPSARNGGLRVRAVIAGGYGGGSLGIYPRGPFPFSVAGRDAALFLGAMMTNGPDFSFEHAAMARGLSLVAGVDEAGRGPLAGPVVAAATILSPEGIPPGLNDSKALSAAKRDALFEILKIDAEIGVGIARVEEIDELNILRASHLAMCRAIEALPRMPDHAIIDGNMIPKEIRCGAEALVKGDARCLSVAAASIVAKCTRDAIMVDLAQQHPGYGWETNMGYPSKAHRTALGILGVTPHHRRSFAPVHKILYQEKT